MDERAKGTMHSEDMSLPMDGGQDVTFNWRCPRHVVLQILQDHRLAGRLYLYAVEGRDSEGRAIWGPANMSMKWRQDQAMWPGTCLAQVIIGSDATVIRKRLGIHPIILSLANIPEWLRAFPDFWQLVGLIPPLRREDGNYQNRLEFQRRERLLLATCLAKVETAVMEAVVDGLRCRWWQSPVNVRNGDMVTRRWMIVMCKNPSDEAEAQAATFRHGYACGQCAHGLQERNGDRRLDADTQLASTALMKGQAKRAREEGIYGRYEEWREHLTNEAKAIFAEGNAYGAELPPHQPAPLQSQQRYVHCGKVNTFFCDHNPLHDVPGTGDEHSRRPPDPMHMVEIGLMQRVLTAIIVSLRSNEGLQEASRPSADLSEDGDDSDEEDDPPGEHGPGQGAAAPRRVQIKALWREVLKRLQQCGLKSFVCNAFYNGCVYGLDKRGQIKMGLTASETVQLFLVMPFVLAGLKVSNSGAAGGRVLKSCIRAVRHLSVWYFHATSPWGLEEDLQKRQSMGVQLVSVLQECFEGIMTFATPKVHMLLHVIGSAVIPYGAWYNCSAEAIELKHVRLKALANNTNRQPGWPGHLMRNHVRTEEYRAGVAELQALAHDVEEGGLGDEEDDFDEDEWSAWLGWSTRDGTRLAVDHASGLSARCIRHRPAFPSWESALDPNGTVSTMQVRTMLRGERERGSARYIGLCLVAALDGAAHVVTTLADHVDGAACLRQLPSAVARYLAASGAHGSGLGDIAGAYGLQPTRIRHILRSGLTRFPGTFSRGPTEGACIQVWSQFQMSNEALTGGARLWGDARHTRDRVHTVRCCPFKCAQFRGDNPTPVVAFVPYANLGPQGEDGALQRPDFSSARPADMLAPGGDSGVCFGRVLLLFKARVRSGHSSQAPKVRDLAFIQPMCRYQPQGRDESEAVTACDDMDRNVHLYEPVVDEDDNLHESTAPVVVPLSRILCQVPVLPDVSSRGRIPPGQTGLEDLPGARCSQTSRPKTTGSRLLYVTALQLKWSRSKVMHFHPGCP